MTMIFKAVGLASNGVLARAATRLAWRFMRTRALRLASAAA